MHIQFNGFIVKGLAIAGLLFALTEQRADAQCGNRSITGGQQNPRMQQYGLLMGGQRYPLGQQNGLQQMNGFQQPMGGQWNFLLQQNALQQQLAIQQFAMQQQYGLQQQPPSQNVLAQQPKPNSQPTPVAVAPVRQTEVYIAFAPSDTSESGPPVDPAVGKERDAKFRLSVIKTLVSTYKHEDARRFADQLAYIHPNSPQAAEAKAIVKSLAKND